SPTKILVLGSWFMKIFQKFFRNKVSYEKIDRYVNLVFKTLDPDDEVYVQYEEENGSQFVKIEVLDRVLH
ncbi:hypothetical protein N9A34_04670, partial [Candidatus Pelagibacter sp.]|nr:hypothetical protein [Candidatus Pelagibacter sp.]